MTELTVAYLAERTNALLTRVDQLLLGQVLVATQAFDSSTSDADPGAGEFRKNHATFASVTKLWIDNVDQNGDSLTPWIDTWDDATSAVRGTLVLRGVDDGTLFAIFKVTGSVVDKTGYREITVTPVVSDGSTWTAGTRFAMVFMPSGDGYAGTSTTTLSLASSGSKAFTTQARLAYAVGSRIRAASAANPTTKFMEGVITAYSGTTLTITADYHVGSGDVSDWNFSIAGEGAPGAAAAATSASAAAASATSAATSATSAASSATAASGSATAAATAKTNAETAEANAEAAQAAAETAETNAETAASSASTSATAAAGSATAAAGSATAASASATAAAASETNAATSATAADASADAAAASATTADGHADRAEAAQAAAEAMVDIEWQGDWSDATTYSVADAVSFDGAAYISIQASNTDNQPDESPLHWHVLGTLGTGDMQSSSWIDTDGTLAANSDGKIATQKATKTAIATALASANTYADGLITAIKAGVSSAFDTLSEIATELGLKAPIASPTFTGTPAAPTAATTTNTTQVATTAFVQQELTPHTLTVDLVAIFEAELD